MKKLLGNFFLLVLCVTITSCGATKKAATTADPVLGSWDYVVKGTPFGDSSGVLVLEKVDGKYAGKMMSEDFGVMKLSNVTVENNELNAEFYIESEYMYGSLSGKIDGDKMTGYADAGGERFTVTATKK